jgi:cation:H+ antiporter
MVLTILAFALGLSLIVKGGHYFVAASVAMAAHARLPRIVIGTTIVSIATTSPEFFVSTTASLQGRPGIAIGNAVGSAILNIGLILSIACLFRPMPINPREFRFPSRVLLAVALLLTLLTLRLTLSRAGGILLVGLGVSYIAFDYLRHRQRPMEKLRPEPSTSRADPRMRTLKRSVLYFLLGLGLVLVGSKLLTDSSVKIAQSLNVPPIIIGLTLVALGTSLPELVTALTSFRKGVADLSLGNIVGAGVMNCTVITGTAAAIRPLSMTRTTQLYNLPALVIVVVSLMALARAGSDLNRKDGAVLLTLYAAYLVGLFLLGGA